VSGGVIEKRHSEVTRLNRKEYASCVKYIVQLCVYRFNIIIVLFRGHTVGRVVAL